MTDYHAIPRITPMKPDDPAYWMYERGIEDPSWRSTPVVHRDYCYICVDPEFALMGLPLCYRCPWCMVSGRGEGHVAADDTECDDCFRSIQEFDKLHGSVGTGFTQKMGYVPMPHVTHTSTWLSAGVSGWVSVSDA